jgi:mannan endo-1,4-beta-mannosidase
VDVSSSLHAGKEMTVRTHNTCLATVRRLSLAALACFCGTLPLHADQATSDPSATARTKATLNWLSNIAVRADNKVVVGQYVTRQLNNTDGRTPRQSWDYYYEGLNDITGKYVGLAGFDFSTREKNQQSGSNNTPSDSSWRTFAMDHHNNGGLLRLMWHSGNPWNDFSAWSSIPAGHTLSEIITPGNPAYTTWMAWLSAAADVLQYYEDNDVPVIWGPLHEGNGTWFWWGGTGTTAASYVDVWRHMYDYFTTTRGLHNLVWIYSPGNLSTSGTATARYPGNAYVDIIGPDKYDNTYTSLYTTFTTATYGKVFAWGEVGQNSASIDNRMYINQIKSTFPKVAFYMQWADNDFPKSIRSNTFADAVMDVDWIITRDELASAIDNSSASVTYSGSWTHGVDPTYYNSSKSVSNTSGDTAALGFTGTTLNIYTKKTPSSGKYDVYIDNAYAATVDGYSANDLSTVKTYSNSGLTNAAHTVRIQLAGQKNASSAGFYVGLDYFEQGSELTIKDNASVEVTFGGTWTHSADATYFNDTKSVSNIDTSTSSLTFTGTQFGIYTKKTPSSGKYDVYIDDVYDSTVDLYASSTQPTTRTFSKTGLPNASHTIRLQVSDQKNAASGGYFVGLDYFDYR